MTQAELKSMPCVAMNRWMGKSFWWCKDDYSNAGSNGEII